MFIDDLRAGAKHMRTALAAANPSVLEGAEAAEVVELCCEVKRYAEAGIALFAPRVAETGAFSDGGHRSAPEWLGQLAGESSGRAKSRLELGARLAEVPELEDAVRGGEVSGEQAKVIAEAAILDPAATGALVDTAAQGDFDGLVKQATAVRQSALSDEEHEARQYRVHRQRRLRPWNEPTGGVNARLFVGDDAWAACYAKLDPVAEQFFQEGRAAGLHESRDAYMADALVALITGTAPSFGSTSTAPCATAVAGPRGVVCGPRAMVHLRVDVESLRRGRTAGDEMCEIDGVGPVSVPAARRLLGDCVFELLVKDGCDLLNLTGHGRNVPTRLRNAILRRDRHCQWPGCHGDVGLEIHHWRRDCALGEVAAMGTLVLLCGRHHDLCTYASWRIEPHPEVPGTWRPVPPVAPVSLDELERRRRLVKRKAESRRRRDAGTTPSRNRDGPAGAA